MSYSWYLAVKLLFYAVVEFDPTQPPRLNERVLKDKRKKLRETFDRVINMYVSTAAVFPVVTKLSISVVLIIFIIAFLPRARWTRRAELISVSF